MPIRAIYLPLLPIAGIWLYSLSAYQPQWTSASSRLPLHRLTPRPIPAPAVPSVKKVAARVLAADKRVAAGVRGLRPCVKQRLTAVLRKLPRRLTLLVTSAFRTREQQRALRSSFGVKAKPGHSPHEDGRAIDVNVMVDGTLVSARRNHKLIGKVMESEGFEYLGPHDPVHYAVPKEALETGPVEAPELQVVTLQEMDEQKAREEQDRMFAILIDTGSL